ncbi:MAG: HTTM domain-containing protein [Acidimicrobiia bacterium]
MKSLVHTLDPRPLGLTRIVVGVAAVIKSLIILPLLLRLTEPLVLNAPVFDWMPSPTPALVWTVVGMWSLGGVLLALGWRVAISGLVVVGCAIFAMCLDLQAYSNHLYLMAWLVLLLVLADAGTGLSIQRAPKEVARWAVQLIPLQISILYIFTGLTKLNPDFLSGQVLAEALRGGLISFPESLRTPAFLSALAVTAVLVEVFLAFALWLPRYRPVAYLLGIGLHLSITLFMSGTGELVVFSLLMFATYPIFAQVRSRQPEVSIAT